MSVGEVTTDVRMRIQGRLGRAAFCGCECSEWYAEDVGLLVKIADQQAFRIRTLQRQLQQHLASKSE